jgi:exopolyphosphatase/guanosine-5'-triphosphate,3'-diphosphate pyrophosphatase
MDLNWEGLHADPLKDWLITMVFLFPPPMPEFPLTFAAIDIGSNAVRLLFNHVYLNPQNQPVFKKVALTRVPVRLGADVFGNGFVSPRNEERLLQTMHAFKSLMLVHGVNDWMGAATSAMREAQNGPNILDRISRETGLNIDLIDGSTEADLIFKNDVAGQLIPGKPYLYIDIGGGSTELTLFFEGEKHLAHSFPIGTVRALSGKILPETWTELKEICLGIKNSFPELSGIGSGGNVVKLFALAEVPAGRPLTTDKTKGVLKRLQALSFEDRIRHLNLNPDRADVILPATEILLFICRHAGIRRLWVPQVGLSDGIVHHLYERWLNSNPHHGPMQIS